MKITSNKLPVTYTVEVSEDELKMLKHVLGPTTGLDDEAAGVPRNTAWHMYHAVVRALGE